MDNRPSCGQRLARLARRPHAGPMLAGTIVLLHSPLTTSAAWGDFPARLHERGFAVSVPEISGDDQPPYASRYVACAALEIAAIRAPDPMVLVAHSGAGPLLPQVAAAQRAARRQVSGYVFIDASLPRPGVSNRLELLETEMPEAAAELRALLESGGNWAPEPPVAGLRGHMRPRDAGFFTESLPITHDWPDAPCGYLRTSSAYDGVARIARLRDWPIADLDADHFAPSQRPAEVAGAFVDLLDRM